MAWQGPNYNRDGHVLFPHYHFSHYSWIRDYYLHRYHPQKGTIVAVPTQQAASGSERPQSTAPGQSAGDGPPAAHTAGLILPPGTLALRPALPGPLPAMPAPAIPLPHPVTPAPHHGQPALTPEQLQSHFADASAPHLGRAAPPAPSKPPAPRLAMTATVRTERLAVTSRPNPDPPHHGFTTSTLLILLALVVLAMAASTYIIGHLFFRNLRRTARPRPVDGSYVPAALTRQSMKGSRAKTSAAASDKGSFRQPAPGPDRRPPVPRRADASQPGHPALR